MSSFLRSFWEGYSKLKPEEFTPVSTWFSYGSNLFKHDFERKMLEHGSFLSLARARPAVLKGWTRCLENESITRGLAYSVKEESNSIVEGIVHDVPIGDLPAFLCFEGILDGSYELINGDKRRYDVRQVTVDLRSLESTQDCLILVGRCPVSDEGKRNSRARAQKKKLVEYIRTSMKGAIDFEIGVKSFEDDLRWVEALE
jgi:hypothetical protein